MNHHSGPAWLEGMRILPQHFQQLEISLRNYTNQQLQIKNNEFWGVASLSIDSEALKQGELNISEVSGVFKDGTQFAYNNSLHERLSILAPSLKAGNVIHIGLSMNEALVHTNNPKGRYVLKSERVIDLTASTINPEDILVKQNAFKLLIEPNEIQGFLTLPIARIKRIHEDSMIELDDTWLMPLLTIGVSEYLSRELKQLLALLQYQQKDISEKVTQSSLNLTTGMHTNTLLLSVLNRYIITLEQKNHWLPKELHEFLYTFYAEVAVFYTKTRLPEQIISYDHLTPFFAFNDIFSKLKQFLNIQSHHQAIRINFDVDEQGLWHAYHNDMFLFKKAAWYLSVHVEAPPETWQDDIYKHIKMNSPKGIQDVIRLQLTGIPFEKISTVPPQLPFLNNTLYFRIDCSSLKWQDVIAEQAINLHIDTHYGDAHFILWAIPESIKE